MSSPPFHICASHGLTYAIRSGAVDEWQWGSAVGFDLSVPQTMGAERRPIDAQRLDDVAGEIPKDADQGQD